MDIHNPFAAAAVATILTFFIAFALGALIGNLERAEYPHETGAQYALVGGGIALVTNLLTAAVSHPDQPLQWVLLQAGILLVLPFCVSLPSWHPIRTILAGTGVLVSAGAIDTPWGVFIGLTLAVITTEIRSVATPPREPLVKEEPMGTALGIAIFIVSVIIGVIVFGVCLIVGLPAWAAIIIGLAVAVITAAILGWLAHRSAETGGYDWGPTRS